MRHLGVVHAGGEHLDVSVANVTSVLLKRLDCVSNVRELDEALALGSALKIADHQDAITLNLQALEKLFDVGLGGAVGQSTQPNHGVVISRLLLHRAHFVLNLRLRSLNMVLSDIWVKF